MILKFKLSKSLKSFKLLNSKSFYKLMMMFYKHNVNPGNNLDIMLLVKLGKNKNSILRKEISKIHNLQFLCNFRLFVTENIYIYSVLLILKFALMFSISTNLMIALQIFCNWKIFPVSGISLPKINGITHKFFIEMYGIVEMALTAF